MASSIRAAERGLLLLAILCAYLHLSTGTLLKGSVTCNDCADPQHDLSGVRLAVTCSKERTSYALTNANGQFEHKIPSSSGNPSSPLQASCAVALLGGTTQLCAFRESMVSHIVAAGGSYALETPLSFFTSCGKIMEREKLQASGTTTGGGEAAVGEEKAPSNGPPASIFTPPGNLGMPPLPPLPPLIYLFPFVPIIGIP